MLPSSLSPTFPLSSLSTVDASSATFSPTLLPARPPSPLAYDINCGRTLDSSSHYEGHECLQEITEPNSWPPSPHPSPWCARSRKKKHLPLCVLPCPPHLPCRRPGLPLSHPASTFSHLFTHFLMATRAACLALVSRSSLTPCCLRSPLGLSDARASPRPPKTRRGRGEHEGGGNKHLLHGVLVRPSYLWPHDQHRVPMRFSIFQYPVAPHHTKHRHHPCWVAHDVEPCPHAS